MFGCVFLVVAVEDALREGGRWGGFGGGGSRGCFEGGRKVGWVCLVVGVEDALREGERECGWVLWRV